MKRWPYRRAYHSDHRRNRNGREAPMALGAYCWRPSRFAVAKQLNKRPIAITSATTISTRAAQASPSGPRRPDVTGIALSNPSRLSMLRTGNRLGGAAYERRERANRRHHELSPRFFESTSWRAVDYPSRRRQTAQNGACRIGAHCGCRKLARPVASKKMRIGGRPSRCEASSRLSCTSSQHQVCISR